MPARRPKDVLLYWTDRVLRSPSSQLAALCLLIMGLVGLGGVLFLAAGSPGNLSANLWAAWSAVTGLGRLKEGTTARVLVVDTALTLTRWFIFGYLVSMIGTAVRTRLTAIRSGATHVFDRGHTVILGFNETVYSVLDLLYSDDEGQSRSSAVILSGKGKDDMERLIGKYCRTRGAQRAICRTGMIDSVADLLRINLPAAKDVIVLGEESGKDALADGHVLRAVLACNQVLSGAPSAAAVNVVIGHRLPQTARVVTRLSERWEHLSAATVHGQGVLAKIVAQCAWQPGLAAVYRDLLTYTGDPLSRANGLSSCEIYCVTAAQAGVPAGTPFEQALWGFGLAVALGYRKGASLVLNPRGDEARAPLAPDDLIVAIAASRRDVRYRPHNPPPDQGPIPQGSSAVRRRVLLVGRGSKSRSILDDLVRYLPAGSVVAACDASGGMPESQVGVEEAGIADLINVPEGRLESLAGEYDTIVIVADERNREDHDTWVLAQMSAIRACVSGVDGMPVVVAELLDPRNRELASGMNVQDILITPELVSNYMVQLAKDPVRAPVYSELLSPEGAELHIRPTADYLPTGNAEVSFAELMACARARGETLIGYWRNSPSEPGRLDLVLNPNKRTDRHPVQHYRRLVVVAPE
ncbi:MAG: hypothetical protein Q8P31_13350 [Bacillota bacterium]|nr:hypothetical protein [Bacillota bacterium]